MRDQYVQTYTKPTYTIRELVCTFETMKINQQKAKKDNTKGYDALV